MNNVTVDNGISVAVAFEQFLANPNRKMITRSKYRYKLAPFLKLYKSLEITLISADLINAWFAEMERTYAEATLAMCRSCLMAFFNFCVDQEWVLVNPARQLPKYDSRPKRIITANEEHMNQVLTFCGILSKSSKPRHRRDAAIFALAAISGARRSNLVHLPFREILAALEKPADSDESVGNIYVVEAKGKTPITVVFGDWHANIVRRWIDVRPTSDHNRLFVHLRSISRGQPLGTRGIGYARRNICKIAGVPSITFQEMRRLKGTQIARKFGLELAAEALGHVSGTRVIREHYYDPDKHAAHVAILETGKS